MALASTKDMVVYGCFCAIFIITIPLFFYRRRYTLISERTPYLVLWMQVPLFGIMTILCLLYNTLIPNSVAYCATILILCLQTLFLCSITARIANVAIKSIQQQHIKSLLREKVPLLRIPNDTGNPDSNHSECLSVGSGSGKGGTVQYLWWHSAYLTKFGRYQKFKHTFGIYALICMPWFVALTIIFAVNVPNAGDAVLNESLFWYRVSICTTQISLVLLVFPLVVVDIFFLTIEISIVALILLGDAVVLLACRYVPPEPSQVLEANMCSHYVYGCLFTVHILTILVPALLTFIPVMRTQRVLLQADMGLAEENTTTGEIDADDTAETADTQEDDTAEYPADQSLPLAVVLVNRPLTTMFYKHLRREYATENFLFLLSINRFRSRFSEKRRMSNRSMGKISSQSTGSDLGRLTDSSNDVAKVVEQVFVDTSAEKGASKHKSIKNKDKTKNKYSNGSMGLAVAERPALLQVNEIVCVEAMPANVSTNSAMQFKIDVAEVAERIHQRFIQPSAEFQVNLTYGCVANIERLLELDDCFATMFDEAARHVSRLLELDSMPRFQKLHGKAIYKALDGAIGNTKV
ncbi:hypothetical protein SARC_12217 [Sphaeroforma arctica JP610]|uniref:RGS domain-containing protein n=1 Tax=Sphaeroforma arctica JP610 TaxID=667725 RepID=A0A0L0FEQ9_9EUKA|nr:hypothetical protein SARC_12217 [Sphaeroforma arctica JP610]KNC75254.1 hypothetical protein SARC_12217 [Sphaeroforma arctica JP610]|eukprot:XP_014149156.1 hypothetical protein SARC_12217 [Sphaeroforma arctica JP610]